MYISIIRSNAYSAILVRSKNKMYSAYEPRGAPPRRISRVDRAENEAAILIAFISYLQNVMDARPTLERVALRFV